MPQTFTGFVGNEKSAKIIPEFHLGNKPEAPKENFFRKVSKDSEIIVFKNGKSTKYKLDNNEWEYKE